jgi:hypothetical protein
MFKKAIRIALGRSRKKFSHKNKISNKIPKKRKEKSLHLSRMKSATGWSGSQTAHTYKLITK